MRAQRGIATLAAVVLGMTVASACGGTTVGTPGASAPAATGASALVSDQVAPKWLLQQAPGMAVQGKSTKAWWTKTTLEEAARAVEPGHWQELNAKNSRPTYLLIMHGAFTPRSYPAGASPEPVPWGFMIIDPTTHIPDGAGGRGWPFNTRSLELHEIDLGALLGE